MSREVPLTLSEKLKLIGAIIFILGFMLPLIRWGIVEGYKTLIRDTKGYEKSMTKAEDYYKLKVTNYKESFNSYTVKVDEAVWKSLNEEQRFAYCQKCQTSFYLVQQKYKMQDEGNQPDITFYVNGSRVAYVTYEETTLY